MKHYTKRKLVSLSLIFALVSSLFPVSAFATQPDGGVTHTHNDQCYETKLACEQIEVEGHSHVADCYAPPTEPRCGLEEHI